MEGSVDGVIGFNGNGSSYVSTFAKAKYSKLFDGKRAVCRSYFFFIIIEIKLLVKGFIVTEESLLFDRLRKSAMPGIIRKSDFNGITFKRDKSVEGIVFIDEGFIIDSF